MGTTDIDEEMIARVTARVLDGVRRDITARRSLRRNGETFLQYVGKLLGSLQVIGWVITACLGVVMLLVATGRGLESRDRDLALALANSAEALAQSAEMLRQLNEGDLQRQELTVVFEAQVQQLSAIRTRIDEIDDRLSLTPTRRELFDIRDELKAGRQP